MAAPSVEIEAADGQQLRSLPLSPGKIGEIDFLPQIERRRYTLGEIVRFRPLRDNLQEKWRATLMWLAPTSEEMHPPS